MPKPTITEQIEALAILRAIATGPHFVTRNGVLNAAKAIDTLDNADLFAALDEARTERESAPIGLPELKPGEEPRPAFSDTHPRAARELGDLMREADK